MSRPIKQGLDYFPVDVEMDDKIEIVEAKHGIAGFGIIIKLYQKIYKEGYFLKWTEETALLFSKKINVDINEVNAVIEDCFCYNILDKNLYSKYKILTSAGIQKRYLFSTERRKEVNLCKNYIIVDINLNNENINWINDDNSTHRIGKERKGKERIEKGKLNLSLPHFQRWSYTLKRTDIGKKLVKEHGWDMMLQIG